MNSFLNSITSLSPVLLVIMPVAGACFGWGISKWGLEFNRWTAFSNTLVSCLILGAVSFAPLLQDENELRPIRAISVTVKLPNVTDATTDAVSPRTFKWALDPTTVWFLMLPTCLWPALVLFSNRIIAASRLHYFLLLLLQAMLAGLLVSHDLISFITFLLLTTFLMLCLIRLWSGSRWRLMFESTMYLQFLGDGFIIGGLLLAATTYTWMQGVLLETPQSLTFQFDAILQGTVDDVGLYPIAQAYWSTTSPWIFLLLLTGFTIKGALFPVHYGLTQWLNLKPVQRLSTPDPVGWYLVLLALITKISIYGMIRFMIPLNFAVGTSLYAVLAGWGTCGFLIAAVIASLRNDLIQITVWFLIGQTALTLTVLFAAESATVPDFIFWNLIQGLACCLLLLIVPLISPQTNSRTDKLLFSAAALSVLTLLGVPGLGGFTSQFQFLWSLSNQNIFLAACYLLGTLLFNLALIRAFWQLVKTEQTEPLSADDQNEMLPNENRRLVWLALSPALLLILIAGISPATLLEKTLFPLREINVSTIKSSAEEN